MRKKTNAQTKIMPPNRRPAPQETRLLRVTLPSLKSLGILTLTTISTELTRLSLSPVYGSSLLPDENSIFAALCVSLSAILIFILAKITYNKLGQKSRLCAAALFPIIGCAIPTITSHFFRYSGRLGPSWGPWVTVQFTAWPLYFFALLRIMTTLESTDNSICHRRGVQDFAVQSLIAVATLLVRWIFRNASFDVLSPLLGAKRSVITSHFGLQLILSCIYAALDGSKLFYVKILLLYLAVTNQHVPLSMNTANLNRTLNAAGYSILARQESLTGYVSVVDNLKDGFRVMRCDHSLLGGEWINLPAGYAGKLREPIYAIFVMLEAVRLAEDEHSARIPTSGVKEGRVQEALVM